VVGAVSADAWAPAGEPVLAADGPGGFITVGS
jgi:hypothetical protein